MYVSSNAFRMSSSGSRLLQRLCCIVSLCAAKSHVSSRILCVPPEAVWRLDESTTSEVLPHCKPAIVRGHDDGTDAARRRYHNGTIADNHRAQNDASSHH